MNALGSVAPEFDWDDANRDHLALHNVTPGEAQQAILDPHAVLLDRNRQGAGSTPTVSIGIGPEDIQRARSLAAKKGLQYQTYLKMLLHEALEHEERRAS